MYNFLLTVSLTSRNYACTGVALGAAVNRIAIFHLCSHRNAGIAVTIRHYYVVRRSLLCINFAYLLNVIVDYYVDQVQQLICCLCVCADNNSPMN